MSEQMDSAGYPKMPSLRPEELSPTGPAPVTVTRAFQLMLASAALGVIGIIIAIATKDSIKDRLLEADPNLENVDTVVTVTLVFTIVIGLVFTAAWVWLAMMVRKGRNWARIVTWVVAGLTLLSGVFGLVSPTNAATAIATAVDAVLAIAIIVLLAVRPSREYFANRA